MDNAEELNDIQDRLKALEDSKKGKDIQQISLPLDEASVRVIEDILPETVAPDYTGLVRFGGDGSDGALTATSGATSIDVGGVAVYVLDYTSLSLTGTASLVFTNPHANGTIVVIKSQGDVTITSSTVPAIDVSGMGAAGGGGASGGSVGVTGNPGNSNNIFNPSPGVGGNNDTTTVGPGGITYLTAGTQATSYTYGAFFRAPFLFCGGGGASGGSEVGSSGLGTGGGGGASIFNPGTGGHNNIGGGSGTQTGSSGAGGRGGGAIYVECGGALSISSTINAKGADGGVGSGANARNGGGGGGGGGTIVILYNTLISNTGTYNTQGGGSGAGGGSGVGAGGVGGAGDKLIAPFTE